MHDIARYIDAQIDLDTYEWGTITQTKPIVRGDCNVLRITLDGEPPQDALIYVRFINLLTHDSYGEISRTLTDGMEIDVPQNRELYTSPGQIGIVFSIETESCKESCSQMAKIAIVPAHCDREYVGETGVKLISDVYAAGEAAETAAAELRQAAINGDFDGADGQPGEDGFSPIITVTDIEGGHRVTVTDAQGTRFFDVLDGEGGGGGAVSPTITVINITGGHRLIIIDADGTKTVDVMDGEQGDTGETGARGPAGIGISSMEQTVYADDDGGINEWTVTLTDGTTAVFEVLNGSRGSTGSPGAPGMAGTDGEDGATFTPSVNSAGLISWTNDKGLPNPASVNIKGPKGDTGATGPQGPKGDTGATGPQGPKGDTGATGATGQPGQNGTTPVKGTDYWTAADKADIVDDVLAALPVWTGGSY